jgi:hypothetical protein
MPLSVSKYDRHVYHMVSTVKRPGELKPAYVRPGSDARPQLNAHRCDYTSIAGLGPRHTYVGRQVVAHFDPALGRPLEPVCQSKHNLPFDSLLAGHVAEEQFGGVSSYG